MNEVTDLYVCVFCLPFLPFFFGSHFSTIPSFVVDGFHSNSPKKIVLEKQEARKRKNNCRKSRNRIFQTHLVFSTCHIISDDKIGSETIILFDKTIVWTLAHANQQTGKHYSVWFSSLRFFAYFGDSTHFFLLSYALTSSFYAHVSLT